jgi:hypothetical protein
VSDQQRLGVAGQRRGEFHENPGGEIGVEPFQRTIALGRRERAFAGTPGKGRGDLDGREAARRDTTNSEQSTDRGAPGVLDVALCQRAGAK